MSTTMLRTARGVPWFVLAISVVVSSIVVFWRATAIERAGEQAQLTARSHFDDVVADHERRVASVTREVEIILVSAAEQAQSDWQHGAVAARLDRLGAADLPGIRAFAVVAAGSASPVVAYEDGIGGADLEAIEALSHPMADHDPKTGQLKSPTPWLASLGSDLMVVGLGDPTERALIAVFANDEFGIGGLEGHHVRTSLVAPPGMDAASQQAAPAEGTTGLARPDHDMDVTTADGSMPADAGAAHHGLPVAVSASTPHFSTTADIDIYGYPWSLSVETLDGFILIPSSREVPVLAFLCAGLSTVLFLLIRRLVRLRSMAEYELEHQAERFAVGFERSPIGVAELDASGTIIQLNEAFADLFHLTQQGLLSRSLASLQGEESAEAAGPELDHGGPPNRGRAELKYVLDDGVELWAHQSISPVPGPDGANHSLVQLVDVTQHHQVRAELEHQALHDELTGLPNRALLNDRLDRALARGRRQAQYTAAMFIDVDHFKQVNDSLGHSVGDQMLVEVARRLSECARSTDTVARFGGDEFVVLCEDMLNPSDAIEVAERARAAMTKPIEIATHSITVSLSIGAAIATSDCDVDAMLRDADLAMYQSKDNGRDRITLFDQAMRDTFIERLALEEALRRAIANGELLVAYQPQYDLALRSICGFEALVRWNHPQLGMLTPDKFLPTADRLRLLADIDSMVLNEAARQLKRWADRYSEAANWTVSVNSSAYNFGDPDYPTTVSSILDQVGLRPSQLILELTEQAVLTNPSTARMIIDELRQGGVKIAIDDFGEGYSSFSQVASLPLDILKVDQSLIQRLDQDNGTEVVRALIQMAHALGLTTVAEGVETSASLDKLRTLKTDQAQGFYIARPMTGDVVEAELQTLMDAAHMLESAPATVTDDRTPGLISS